MSFPSRPFFRIFILMIYYFIPYDTNKKLLRAIDRYMSLIEDDDWACLMDGDTAFLRSDFGHRIQEYVDKYPDTGMFTCYASRCHYSMQVRKGTDMNADSILYHKRQADKAHRELHPQTKVIRQRTAGHMMLIKKSTWKRIRRLVYKRAGKKDILGVDTKISTAVLSIGLRIRLMRGIYIFHYMRFFEGFSNKNHFK